MAIRLQKTDNIRRSCRQLTVIGLLCAFVGPAAAWQQAYVILGSEGQATARVLTDEHACPDIRFDEQAAQPMTIRVAPGNAPDRRARQPESVTAFPVRVCETTLPPGTRQARVANQQLPIPTASPRRIVLLGDTGCRLKAADNAYQACNHPDHWPFAAIARQAAAWQPDLVIHLGDILYREDPCPADQDGCAGSPSGYGFATWKADFFTPAAPLLAAAPWVAVRGNHESCARAGQGWFRFIDPNAYDPSRSCDQPEQDTLGDFSSPYAVPLANDTRVIVFDSSKAAGKPLAPEDYAAKRYAADFREVDTLSSGARLAVFLSHHPVLGFATSHTGQPRPGNAALQSVMQRLHPDRLFPREINLALHGHVHLFEAIRFRSDHPATVINGHSGSALNPALQLPLNPTAQPAPGAEVDEIFAEATFGFATLELEGKRWRLVSRSISGTALLECDLIDNTFACSRSLAN